MKNITVPEFKTIKENPNTLLVDVRSSSEFTEGHIPGALSVPLNEFESKINLLKKDAQIVCQCLSGGRSKVAALYLTGLGFNEVYNLEGGLSSWMASGGEVVRE
jgi:rhodanese-related sulfurtransferase